MPKNILIFSDGTDNDTGGLADQPNPDIKPNSALSNVYRLYVASNPSYQPSISALQQIAFYDAGLGSEENTNSAIRADLGGWVPKPLYKLLSKMTGLGITQNIADCYHFIVKNYVVGDRIFLFGFSRGAYTVRSLGGVLSQLGVLRRDNLSDTQIKKGVRNAVEIYKIRDPEERKNKATEVSPNYHKALPHAICVFDTVSALGLTGGTLKNLDMFGDAFAPHRFHNDTLSSGVPFAFHAVSVDEERKHFKVVLWDNPETDNQVLKQVWFPGVHSDIGGSYRDRDNGTVNGRDLGRLTLEWMIKNLEEHETGFMLNKSALDLKENNGAKAYHLGEMHNERKKKKLFGLAPVGYFWPKGIRENAKDAPLHPDAPSPVGQLAKKVKNRFDQMETYEPESLVGRHPKF